MYVFWMVLSVRSCQSNGITAPDENFLLLPDWRLQHADSKLCVAAMTAAEGSAVTLQPCNSSEPLQLWKNDYSNIHHGLRPLVLEGPNLTLTGSYDGSVTTRNIAWKKSSDWTQWSVFDSTGQLRNQRTPRDPKMPVWCLALCKDPAT